MLIGWEGVEANTGNNGFSNPPSFLEIFEDVECELVAIDIRLWTCYMICIDSYIFSVSCRHYVNMSSISKSSHAFFGMTKNRLGLV